MSATSLAAPTPARLRPSIAFALLVSIAVALLAGSSAPTPLYAIYQAEWGFSPITVTVVFGIYALAVLAALLVFGRLSDHVGRRPVLLVALAVQVVVMVVFATAGGVPELLLARVLQGLSTGAALGALGAGLLDLDRARGTVANAVAPMTGTATGALVAAVLVQYLPAPTQLVYVLLAGVFAVQWAGVALMAETAAPRPGARASLRPQFALPVATRRPLLVAAPALVAAWSLAGFYGSLGPSLVRLVAGSDWIVLGGLALFVLAGSGALTVLLMGDVEPQRMMGFGTLALFAGVGVTLLATLASSAVVFFAGAVIAGAGFGAAFQGALRTVVPTAAMHERAGVLSIVFVVSYLAMGLPAIVGGVLVVDGGGVLVTAREYGAAAMTLAALALLGLVTGARRKRAQAAVGCPASA
jgi:predicted MFS family arabinose efflux permease